MVRLFLRVSVFTAAFCIPIVSYFINTSQMQVTSAGEVLSATTSVQETVDPMLQEINTARRAAKLPDLKASETNTEIASIRSTEISKSKDYTHTRSDNSIFSSLYKKLPRSSCENLQLQNTDSLQDAVNAWLQSPGHRACLLDEEITNAGIAFEQIYDNNSRESLGYVFVFVGSSQN